MCISNRSNFSSCAYTSILMSLAMSLMFLIIFSIFSICTFLSSMTTSRFQASAMTLRLFSNKTLFCYWLAASISGSLCMLIERLLVTSSRWYCSFSLIYLEVLVNLLVNSSILFLKAVNLEFFSSYFKLLYCKLGYLCLLVSLIQPLEVLYCPRTLFKSIHALLQDSATNS